MKRKNELQKLFYVLTMTLIIVLLNNKTQGQNYININLSGGGNLYSLLSDMKEITFDGSGNATFTKTDDTFVTQTISSVTDLTFDASAGSGGALPVELVDFIAEITDSSVLLKWKTATEINNYGFEVERQISDISSQQSEWETLEFILGSGNSNSPKEYEYSDNLTNLEADLSTSSLEYRLKQIDTDGGYEYFSLTAKVGAGTLTDIQDELLPSKFELKQNYPNPFNPSTTINFSIPTPELVSLKIYNSLGQEVAVLINQNLEAGYHSAQFNGSNLSSGVYFSRLTAGNNTSLIKMLMLK